MPRGSSKKSSPHKTTTSGGSSSSVIFATTTSTTTTTSTATPKLYTATPRSRSSSRDNTTAASWSSSSTTNTASYAAAISTGYGGSTESQTTTPESSPLRSRFNSRDLPRTYSGQYASGGDTNNDSSLFLMPLECIQQEQFLQAKVSTGVFFCMYLSLIFALHLLSTSIAIIILHDIPTSLSWTLTNVLHLIFSLIFIHFNKGSFLVVGEQGELNAMTVWEQLEATPESSTHMRRTLLIVPTILSYIAIAISNFETNITMINVGVWCIAMIPKLSVMNGVRLFGINRTAGIDDEQEQQALLFFMNTGASSSGITSAITTTTVMETRRDESTKRTALWSQSTTTTTTRTTDKKLKSQ